MNRFMQESNKPQLLLVEDSKVDQALIKTYLRDEYEVTCLDSIQSAKSLIDSVSFDLAIIDLQLPDGSGLEFCEKIKLSNGQLSIPTLLLTASKEMNAKVAGFYMGIWDYMTKPVDIVELKLRLHSMLLKSRISKGMNVQEISVGDLTLNLQKFDARVRTGLEEEEIVSLTPIEFRIMKTLMDHKDSILTRDAIVKSVWNAPMKKSMNRTLDVHIANLRKKMGHCGRQIKSIYGVGYTIEGQNYVKDHI